MAIVDIAPRTPQQEAAASTHRIAAPFLRAADNINPAIPESHRQGIVMLACGLSYRLIALEIDVDVHTVLRWRRQYARDVEAMRPAVQRIAGELVGGLCGDLVAVGLAAIPGLAQRAREGKMDGREMLALTMAAGRLADLAGKIEDSPKVRANSTLTASREQAQAAIASLKALN